MAFEVVGSPPLVRGIVASVVSKYCVGLLWSGSRILHSQLSNDGILKNSCCNIPFQAKCIS